MDNKEGTVSVRRRVPRCPNGHRCDEQDSFCPVCGTKISGNDREKESAAPAPKKEETLTPEEFRHLKI